MPEEGNTIVLRDAATENDIATLMQLYQPALDPLFAELSKHLSTTDLKSVRDPHWQPGTVVSLAELGSHQRKRLREGAGVLRGKSSSMPVTGAFV